MCRKHFHYRGVHQPCQTAKEGWICNCSTRILGFLPVTVHSLFSIIFPFSNEGPSPQQVQLLQLPGFEMSPFTPPTPRNNPTPSLSHCKWFLAIKHSRGVVRTADGHKMAWCCIILNYNNEEYICTATCQRMATNNQIYFIKIVQCNLLCLLFYLI
jgi:hypothetical protein